MELDEKRFKDLIHRQRDLIWRVCSSYRLSAAWTTEDAFHEVLCNLWRGYKNFDQRSNESTWVYRVAANCCMDPDHYEQAYSDDYRDLVELIESTPEPDRTIINAHAQGYGYKEIGQITGLSVAAVSMRLSRALRKLRKHYNQQ